MRYCLNHLQKKPLCPKTRRLCFYPRERGQSVGKHELKNKKDEGKWNWALLAANVLLTLCFAAVFWPILHKGSLSFLDKTARAASVEEGAGTARAAA